MAQAPKYSTTRMEAFSDGVFAIAITLLILAIGISEGAEGHLGSALFDERLRYNLLLLLVVSFLPFPTGLLSEYISAEGA